MNYLTQDIVSTRGFIYAKANDQVEIVSDHGNVVIVQDTSGNRFSCRREFITNKAPKKEDENKKTEAQQPEQKQGSAPSSKKETKTVKKEATGTQLGMFN